MASRMIDWGYPLISDKVVSAAIFGVFANLGPITASAFLTGGSVVYNTCSRAPDSSSPSLSLLSSPTHVRYKQHFLTLLVKYIR